MDDIPSNQKTYRDFFESFIKSVLNQNDDESKIDAKISSIKNYLRALYNFKSGSYGGED
jgi:hypothetical protein